MIPLRVLLIEDSEDDALCILRELRRGGYEPTWERVDTRKGLLTALSTPPWDLITCAWTLPQFSALSALQLLRNRGVETPLLVVTGETKEEFAVAAIKEGACEFVSKYRLQRLCPAVRREVHETRTAPPGAPSIQGSKLYNDILTNMSAGVYLIRTSDGTIVYSNPRFDELFGYAPGELIGRHVSVVNASSDQSAEDTARKIIEALNRDGYWHGEVYNQKKDGTRFWCWAGVSTFEHPDFGAVWVAAHQDITAAKQTEEELAQSQSLLRAIVEGTSDAVYVKDLQGNYVLFNPACERLVGKRAREVLGKNDMSLWVADQARELMEVDRHVIEARQTVASEDVLTTGGEPRIFLSVKSPIFDDRGKVIGLFGISRDITRRKLDEEEIRALNAELEARVDQRTVELNQRNDELRVLSHRLVEAQEQERQFVARELHDEIGQVLTGLLLTLEASLKASRVPKGRVKTALALARDLLRRVRFLSLELRPIMLDDLGLLDTLHWHFERYTEQTQVRVAFSHAGLETRFAPDMELAVYRVVQEALTNVARHAAVKDASVSIEAKGQFVHVRVEDHGVGMEHGPLPYSMGTGLRNISERAAFLGGTLSIDSAPGAGTRVEARLPLSSRNGDRVGLNAKMSGDFVLEAEETNKSMV